MKNNHVFFVHILQYLLITWGKSEMILLGEEASLSFEKDIFGLKWKWEKKMFRMNSFLYSPHENVSYTFT
jgi:hypothetical protein